MLLRGVPSLRVVDCAQWKWLLGASAQDSLPLPPQAVLLPEAFLVFLIGSVPLWFSVGLEVGGLLGVLLSQMDTSVSLLEEGLCRQIPSRLTPKQTTLYDTI